ncbi:MAG: hypothetical protein ACHBNF_12435 [Chromatiales bacterium]
MSTKLPLDGRIKTAAQLATRARIFYDIWWFYEGAGTRPRILSTMNEYSEFFRFDSHAHFVALVVHLASLLSRSDSVNFSTLVTEAKASGDFPPEAITEAEAISSRGAGVVTESRHIARSNLFAHRSASLSFNDTFQRASITGNQLRELTNAGFRIANVLLAARNQPAQFLHNLPKQDAESLLNDLADVCTT